IQHTCCRVRIVAEALDGILANTKHDVSTVNNDIRYRAAVQYKHIVRLAANRVDGRSGARYALVGLLVNQHKIRLHRILVGSRIKSRGACAAWGYDAGSSGTLGSGYTVVPHTVGSRKITTLWVAILGSCCWHMNRWIGIWNSYF